MRKTSTLSIFTVGYEHDCAYLFYNTPGPLESPPKDVSNWIRYDDPNANQAIISFVKQMRNKWTGYSLCSTDGPDPLHIINKFYYPPGQSYEPIGWGAGAHTNEKSLGGDFTLRYTISVEPIR